MNILLVNKYICATSFSILAWYICATVYSVYPLLLDNLFFRTLSVARNTKLKLPQTKRWKVLRRLSCVGKIATSSSGIISFQLQVQQVGGKAMLSNVLVLEFTLTRPIWIQSLYGEEELGVTRQNQSDLTRMREYECWWAKTASVHSRHFQCLQLFAFMDYIPQGLSLNINL